MTGRMVRVFGSLILPVFFVVGILERQVDIRAEWRKVEREFDSRSAAATR
jgi:hypothetical protein